MQKPAVFIDRDGTLIKDVSYIKDVEDLELFDKTIFAIKKLNQAGYRAIVVSNQSGVARRYCTESDVKRINAKLKSLLQEQGAYLDGFYYCSHYKQGIVKEYAKDCNCRKPETGLIKQALRAFPDINLKKSYVVGDKACDVKLAQNAGCRGVLVLTGHGEENRKLCCPDFVAEDIDSAVEWILKDSETAEKF